MTKNYTLILALLLPLSSMAQSRFPIQLPNSLKQNFVPLRPALEYIQVEYRIEPATEDGKKTEGHAHLK